jgi:4-amino-4-deoxy-L-arabinose transferase-like glycosyltransferase
MDESSIALNVIDRSYSELLKPLAYSQQAPVGFLWAERFLYEVFGRHDITLRLFPFLLSVVSVFAFYQLPQLFLTRPFRLLSMALFSLKPKSGLLQVRAQTI